MRLIFPALLLSFATASAAEAAVIINPDPQVTAMMKQQQEMIDELKLIEEHLAHIEKLHEYEATLQRNEAVAQAQQHVAAPAAQPAPAHGAALPELPAVSIANQPAPAAIVTAPPAVISTPAMPASTPAAPVAAPEAPAATQPPATSR